MYLDLSQLMSQLLQLRSRLEKDLAQVKGWQKAKRFGLESQLAQVAESLQQLEILMAKAQGSDL